MKGDENTQKHTEKVVDKSQLPLLAKVLTVSDGVFYGTRRDLSGDALVEYLTEIGWDVVDRSVTEDGLEEVACALKAFSKGFHGLIVTTGGTGFGPRDQTPEGTRKVIDREAPGLAEVMRLCNQLGRLSRSVAGTIETSLILNTPGSQKGCVECLDSVSDVLPHAVRLLVDNADVHPSTEDSSDSSHG